jgi:hypothetical protein
MINHLENVRVLVNNYGGSPEVPAYNKLLTNLQSEHFNIQDGISHSINDIKDVDPAHVSEFDEKFHSKTDVDLPCLNCRYGVILNTTSPNYKEYKSITCVNSNGVVYAPNISINQMMNYFVNNQNLDGLEYVLNSRKTTEVQAKEAFRLYLKGRAQTILIGLVKFQTLFQQSTVDGLIDALNNPEQAEIILRFVKV